MFAAAVLTRRIHSRFVIFAVSILKSCGGVLLLVCCSRASLEWASQAQLDLVSLNYVSAPDVSTCLAPSCPSSVSRVKLESGGDEQRRRVTELRRGRPERAHHRQPPAQHHEQLFQPRCRRAGRHRVPRKQRYFARTCTRAPAAVPLALVTRWWADRNLTVSNVSYAFINFRFWFLSATKIAD